VFRRLVVPAPGFEPGQTKLQRLAGCQLPYAGALSGSPSCGCRTGVTAPRYRLGKGSFLSASRRPATARCSCHRTPSARQPGGSWRWPPLAIAAAAQPSIFPVRIRAAPHIDAQASVVALAGVPANRRGVVLLERSFPELRAGRLHCLQPERLCGLDVCALVDVDPEDEPVRLDPRGVKKPEEEADQRRIAIDEGNAVSGATACSWSPRTSTRWPRRSICRLLSKPACAIAASLMASRLAARAGRSASQYRRTASACCRRHSS
jgi:hypothetical protein